MKYDYDILIIGSGSAGFAAASAAKGVGRKIGIVESDIVGGECPSFGCVPSKALLYSAKMWRTANSLSVFGITVKDAVFDFSRAVKRKDDLTRGLAGPRAEKVADELGIDVLKGRAAFLDAHTVNIGKKKVTSDKFIIATGSIPKEPSISGIGRSDYWTYKDAVSVKEAPRRLLIVGGGAIGVEMATFFASVGSSVTVVELSSQLLNFAEPEISQLAEESLIALGATVMTSAEIIDIVKTESGSYTTRVNVGGGIEETENDKILFALGKKPNISGLGLKAAGVETDGNGRLKTNLELRTSVKHIWAAGDVRGGMQFTHVAHYEGSVAGFNAFSDKPIKVNEKIVPRVVFAVPEIACVGETEETASKTMSVATSVFPISKLGRAYIDGETRGLVKLVADKKTGKIVGGSIAAPHAGEMIHEVALAIHCGMTVDNFVSVIHAYPTYSEAILAAAGSIQI
ncbi:MAG: NAD(P)/FAD-dependent oxidoreductase [Patescibacteria group bacterium]